MVNRGCAPIRSAASSSARLRPAGRCGSTCRAAAPRQFGQRASAGSAPPKWLMSSRKVTGPTLSLRISRRARPAAARRRAAPGRGALACAGLSGLLCAELTAPSSLLAQQAPDIGVVLAKKRMTIAIRMSEQSRPCPAAAKQARHASGADQRRERGIARDQGDARARPRRRRRRPANTAPSRTPMIGRDAFAAAESEPDRKEMAEEGAEAGDVGSAGRPRSDVARRLVTRHGTCLSAGRAAGSSAARPLWPVRSTLVAPMLPEPIWRTSPRPGGLVRSRPKGMEPSR